MTDAKPGGVWPYSLVVMCSFFGFYLPSTLPTLVLSILLYNCLETATEDRKPLMAKSAIFCLLDVVHKIF